MFKKTMIVLFACLTSMFALASLWPTYMAAKVTNNNQHLLFWYKGSRADFFEFSRQTMTTVGGIESAWNTVTVFQNGATETLKVDPDLGSYTLHPIGPAWHRYRVRSCEWVWIMTKECGEWGSPTQYLYYYKI